MTDIFVSGSEFKTYRRCRRRWMIEFVWRLTLPRPEPGALGLGIITHEGLQVITEGGSLEAAHERVLSVVKEQVMELSLTTGPVTEQVVETWMQTANTAQNYLTGYVEWLESTGSDQRYETYAAEQELTMPLIYHHGYSVTLRGKLDRRMFDRWTERHVFMDYKTCMRFEDIINSAYRNEQFPTYELLLRNAYPGERCGSGVWRMLRKVERARNGDGDFYRDHQASFNDKTMSAVRQRYEVMAREMVDLRLQIEDGDSSGCYPSPDFRCEWDCPYKHECPMFDDGSRIQDAIQDQYVSFDPYARYEQKGSE